MCGIAGWFGGSASQNLNKRALLERGSLRGRDGWGFQIEGSRVLKYCLRSLSPMTDKDIEEICKGSKVVGNFRATPTTEALSKLELLQPYDGFVHNGTIANDKKFGDYPIDSMVLPGLLKGVPFKDLPEKLSELEGSYALAWFLDDCLILACNYKPIYFSTDWASYFLFGSIPEMLPHYACAMKPYTIMKINCSTFQVEELELPRIQHPGVIVSASSGLDSTTVAYYLKDQGHEVTLAHFRYGCLAESTEIKRLEKIAQHGNFNFTLLDLPKVFGGTIVEGTYCAEGIRGTEYAEDWVSARNLLMLSVLTAYAETNKIGRIAFGSNLEESLPGDTQLLLKDKEKVFVETIENLLDYDLRNIKTISVNSKGFTEESAIEKVMVHECKYSHLLEIVDELGRSVRLTPCHSIMVYKNGVFTSSRTDELKVGDWVLTPELNKGRTGFELTKWEVPAEFLGWVKNLPTFPFIVNGVILSSIKSIEEVVAPLKVYDLSVPGNENFLLANGILVHNSGSYPDNEQEFGRLFNKILPYSTQNGTKIELLHPLSTYMKHEIVRIGNEVGVPWELTWSCYSDKDSHCGSCGPCFMRKTAFKRNGIKDPAFKHEWNDPFWDGCK